MRFYKKNRIGFCMRVRRFCAILFIFLLVGSLFSSCGQWVTDRLQQQAEESLRQGDYTQAAELFSRLIEAEPDNPRAYTGLAEAYTGLGEMDHAAQAIQQGMTQLPGNEEIAGFFYTPMLLVGGWSYYPEGYGGDGTNYYGYSEDEWGSRNDFPFSFQFRLDGTVTYKEARQIHNVGSAGAHVPFTEGFDGTYRTQGNRVVMEFTDTGRILGVQKAYGYGMGTATPLNEPVRMEMEILQVQGDTLVLQWLSGGPFYFEAPNDFEMIPQALAEGPLRFRSVALAGEFPGGFESSYDWPYDSVLTRPDTPAGRDESFPASDICDVRSGPGQEYGAADEAIPAGTWVTKIGQMAGNDDWYFVEYSRDYRYDGYPQGAGDPAGFVYRFYGWVSTECLTGA